MWNASTLKTNRCDSLPKELKEKNLVFTYPGTHYKVSSVPECERSLTHTIKWEQEATEWYETWTVWYHLLENTAIEWYEQFNTIYVNTNTQDKRLYFSRYIHISKLFKSLERTFPIYDLIGVENQGIFIVIFCVEHFYYGNIFLHYMCSCK